MEETAKGLDYITYDFSIIFNNNMDRRKEQEVLISQMYEKEKVRLIKMTKYPKPEHIPYSNNSLHRKIYNHARNLLGFITNRRAEEDPLTVSFLDDYVINEN